MILWMEATVLSILIGWMYYLSGVLGVQNRGDFWMEVPPRIHPNWMEVCTDCPDICCRVECFLDGCTRADPS